MNETLSLFRMPILIFLSGMLLPRSLSKDSSAYFSGKLKGILWPFIIWSTIYGIAVDIHFRSFADLEKLYTGGSHLWFLLFIFIYYLAAKPLQDFNPLLIAAVAFIFSIASPDGAKYSERLFYLMSLFFLGAYASIHMPALLKSLTSQWIWVIAPIVAATAAATAMYELRFGPKYIVLSLVGAMIISAMAIRAEKTIISSILIWIGQKSIIFYVSHAVFMTLTLKAFRYYEVENYATVAIFAISSALLGGWTLAVLKDFSRPVSWLFSFPDFPQRRQAVQLS
ncbi:acyltransferase family protein [Paracoccus sp. 228]|uniref:acyltransferase family protein n=1 Tax=Paracoccus sp. 228 TaxID=1192054 RepID=UPI002100A9D5|nr:acyltransferase family protein [Paracoccus sp. 228]